MDNFRRPLGVLLFAVLAAVVGIVMLMVAAASDTNSWLWSAVGGWVIVLALLAALGALGVIAWRLVRRPKSRSAE